MTDPRRSDEDEQASATEEPRRRKRKKKNRPREGAEGESKREASTEGAPARAVVEPAANRPADSGPGRALLFAGAVLGSMVLYVANTLGDGRRSFALLAVSIAGFAFGTASRIDPHKILIGAGGLAVIGIAIAATSPSPIGVACAVAGGFTLAGGIHRFGRLGPAEA